MRTPLVFAALAMLAAGCSSSGSTHPAAAGTSPGIGQIVAPSTSPVAATAELGSPITQGALTITVAGPVTTEHSDKETLATFHVTMTNTAKTGDVVSPDWFGVRCDANRDQRHPGDMMASSTLENDQHIGAGKTMTGTAVEAWLTSDSTVKCTGVTTIEARFLGTDSFLAWTLPDDVVAQVNKAGGTG